MDFYGLSHFWDSLFFPFFGLSLFDERCLTVSFYNIFEECTAHLAAVTDVTALDVITLTSGNTRCYIYHTYILSQSVTPNLNFRFSSNYHRFSFHQVIKHLRRLHSQFVVQAKIPTRERDRYFVHKTDYCVVIDVLQTNTHLPACN